MWDQGFPGAMGDHIGAKRAAGRQIANLDASLCQQGDGGTEGRLDLVLEVQMQAIHYTLLASTGSA